MYVIKIHNLYYTTYCNVHGYIFCSMENKAKKFKDLNEAEKLASDLIAIGLLTHQDSITVEKINT